ncbi:MAG: hypothetical protein V1781_00815 [Bacteroidota bacterium]
MKLLMILILSITFLSNSCRKKGNKYCTWKSETTGMNILINTNIFDTCKYDSIQITLKFGTKYLTEWPPCGTFNDSIISNIEYLNVLANYYYNNDTIMDTINDIIKAKIDYYTNESIFINLNDISFSHPRCHSHIYLFLITPTDTNCLQSFTINYKETDGTFYTATTTPIYVTH